MRRHESYQTARSRRQKIARILKVVLISFIVYQFCTAFLVKTVQVRSDSMSPTYFKGDRLFVAPSAYSIETIVSTTRIRLKAPARGDVVVVRTHAAKPESWLERTKNDVLSFFTLRRFPETRAKGSGHVIKRVIAVPGDIVKMENSIVLVKAAGSSFFLTEYELTGKSYDLGLQGLPENWDKSLPASSSYPERKLGDDEYFVVGDNRTSFSDSRFFGPVSHDDILARVLVRYWPFIRARSDS